MLTIEKRMIDRKTYVVGLSAMAICLVGSVTAMAVGGVMTSEVASVTPVKKTAASTSPKAKPTPSQSPSSSPVMQDEAQRSTTYSSPSPSVASSPTPSTQPIVTTTPTPTTTPDPSPSPEPTPSEPPVVEPEQ